MLLRSVDVGKSMLNKGYVEDFCLAFLQTCAIDLSVRTSKLRIPLIAQFRCFRGRHAHARVSLVAAPRRQPRGIIL